MKSDYRSKDGKNRKIQKNYRSCMERTRSTPEDVWKVTTETVWLDPEELKKLYGKDQKHSRRCMERTRSTPEDVWKVTTEAVW